MASPSIFVISVDLLRTAFELSAFCPQKGESRWAQAPSERAKELVKMSLTNTRISLKSYSRLSRLLPFQASRAQGPQPGVEAIGRVCTEKPSCVYEKAFASIGRESPFRTTLLMIRRMLVFPGNE